MRDNPVRLPLHDLLRDPDGVIGLLDTARSVVLTRPSGTDLTLARFDTATADDAVTALCVRLLGALARLEHSTALRQGLAEALPWTTFLTEHDRDALLVELIDTTAGASSLGVTAPVAVVLRRWQAAARRRATEPEVVREVRLTRPQASLLRQVARELRELDDDRVRRMDLDPAQVAAFCNAARVALRNLPEQYDVAIALHEDGDSPRLTWLWQGVDRGILTVTGLLPRGLAARLPEAVHELIAWLGDVELGSRTGVGADELRALAACFTDEGIRIA